MYIKVINRIRSHYVTLLLLIKKIHNIVYRSYVIPVEILHYLDNENDSRC